MYFITRIVIRVSGTAVVISWCRYLSLLCHRTIAGKPIDILKVGIRQTFVIESDSLNTR